MEDDILNIIVECIVKMYDLSPELVANEMQKVPGQIVFDKLNESGYEIILKGTKHV